MPCALWIDVSISTGYACLQEVKFNRSGCVTSRVSLSTDGRSGYGARAARFERVTSAEHRLLERDFLNFTSSLRHSISSLPTGLGRGDNFNTVVGSMAAHGNGGGMLGHVRKQNAPEVKRQRSKESIGKEFKVPVPPIPKTKTPANTPVIRNLRSRSQHKASHGEDEVNRPSSLFGTNASNVDESSPTEQTERHQARSDYQPSQNEQYEEGSEGVSDEDGGEEYDHREQDDPNDSLQAQGPARGFGQIHVKDDSYPTTSQFADERQLLDDRTNARATYQHTDQAMLPHQASGTRVAPHQSKQMPSDWSQQQQQQSSRQKQQSAPQLQEQRIVDMRGAVQTNADEVVGDINSGFSYGLARPGRQNVPTQPQVPAHNSVHPSRAVQPEFTRAPNPAPVSDVRQHPRVESPRPNTPIQGKQVEHRPKARRKSGQHAQTALVDPAQERQHLNNTLNGSKPQVRQVPVQPPVQHEELPQEPQRALEPEPETDYDPPDLYKMEYAHLKAESFDIDPSAAEFRFPDNVPINDLPQKLECVAKLNEHDQAEFFASLSIDAWEEAGDWFLQRFGDLTKRLKETRREKRKAVEALEGEIQDRHNAVSKKQRMTLAAMGEMKESGGKVLQGTPKKTRKSK